MKEHQSGRWQAVYRRLEENKILLSIRQGMMLAVPLIMTGAVALLLLSIPIPAYQDLLSTLFGGAVRQFLSTVQGATLGMVSFVILVTTSISYESLSRLPYRGVVPMVSLCSYVAFTAGGDQQMVFTIFESTWLFHAIFCGVVSSAAFVWLKGRLPEGGRIYTDGEDDLFQYALHSVIPAAAVIAAFALCNRLLMSVFGTSNIQTLFWESGNRVFDHLGRNLGSGLLFLLLMHLMWFFGIHGSNVLDDVARNVFNAGLDVNTQLVAAGQAPTEVISKPFFDTFALFGGCGALLCLILAILLAERRTNIRRLTKAAFLPALFNMNELMIFGLPIVLNPVYLIPFVGAPMLLAAISYFATVWGFVPYVTHAVEWTTPIFLSGYVATGSVAGSLLQLFNLAVGTAVYFPFVRLAQKLHHRNREENISRLADEVRAMEQHGQRQPLTARTDLLGMTAKGLAGDLRRAIRAGQVQLHYQPQVNRDGVIVGAEALLRWHRENGQCFYPPLVIAIAEETGQMEDLGSFIIQQACADLEELTCLFGNGMEISINLTAGQISDGNVLQEIRDKISAHRFKGKQLGLELTEQTALQISPEISEQLQSMRGLGMQVIMDDFGMGHSSMMYLRENQFDVVKLDGSLVRDVLTNKRSRDIISSIIYLAESLEFQVIAEFVETEEQRAVLEELGCVFYQGYLFSKPAPFEDLIKLVAKNRNGIEQDHREKE